MKQRLTVAAVVLVGALVVAQAPAFDVTSVKINRSGEIRVGFGFPPGGMTATNLPLRSLIIQAYRLQEYELLGLPDWAATERFDIAAKTSNAQATGPDRLVMLRTLLVDRFKLRLHAETREMAMYSLVFARADKQLGPNLKPSTTDCAALARGGQPPPPPTPPRPGEAPPMPECGVSLAMTPTGQFLRAGNMAFPDLVRLIAQNVGRPVVDRTGLTGSFTVQMRFVSDAPGIPGLPLPRAPQATSPDDNNPSLMTAVQEQLGLKLESGRAPVPVQIVDSVDRPTED